MNAPLDTGMSSGTGVDETNRKRARRNVILALVHVLLAIVVLVAFVITQAHR